MGSRCAAIFSAAATVSLVVAVVGSCASFSSDTSSDGGAADVVPGTDADSALGSDGDPSADAIVSLSAGFSSVCAVRASGKLYCWGDNSALQLGIETGDGSCEPQPCRSVPALVEAVPDAVQVSVGRLAACAVRAGGDVVCWGSNEEGIAGTGVAANAKMPPLKIVDLPKAIEVATSFQAACARVEGATGNEVWCWGTNTSALLGITPGAGTYRPVKIKGADGAKALRMSPTSASACIVNQDDSVSCWGRNEHGFLGHSPNTNLDVPCETGAACNPKPMLVGTAFKVDRLAVGNDFGCARRLDETLACWGANEWGALARTPDTGNHPGPVDVVLPPKILDLDAGGSHVCARVEGGRVMCWGSNIEGEVGNGLAVVGCAGGPVACTPTPTLVTDSAGVAHLSLGESLTIAVAESGGAWAWGFNDDGQLGHPPGKGPDVVCTGSAPRCSAKPSPLVIP